MTLQVRGSEAEIVPLTNQRGDPIEAMATGELLTGTWRVAIRGRRRGRANGTGREKGRWKRKRIHGDILEREEKTRGERERRG